MKILHRILALFAALSFIFVLLITAAEGAIYLDFHYYEKEYEKYGVLDDLNMEMEDAMYVTREMMDYLHGKRDNLEVGTVVGGVEQEFFNTREKEHMADVENLFHLAIIIRWVSLGVFVVTMAVLLLTKADWKKLVSKWYMAAVTLLVAGMGVMAFLFTRDFNKYFVRFHEIFFDNDLWILDPETDLLIRMLPEGFFADFAARIGIFAGGAVLLFFIVSFVLYKISRRKEEDRNLYQL